MQPVRTISSRCRLSIAREWTCQMARHKTAPHNSTSAGLGLTPALRSFSRTIVACHSFPTCVSCELGFRRFAMSCPAGCACQPCVGKAGLIPFAFSFTRRLSRLFSFLSIPEIILAYLLRSKGTRRTTIWKGFSAQAVPSHRLTDWSILIGRFTFSG
jgi:hypothetical protein